MIKTLTTHCIRLVVFMTFFVTYGHKSDSISHATKADSLKQVIKTSKIKDDVIYNKILLTREYLLYNNLDNAHNVINDLLTQIEGRQDSLYLGLTMNLKAIYHFSKNDLNNCILYGKKSIDILDKYHSPSTIETIYNSHRYMAFSYMYMNSYKEAVDLFLKSLNYLPTKPQERNRKKI